MFGKDKCYTDHKNLIDNDSDFCNNSIKYKNDLIEENKNTLLYKVFIIFKMYRYDLAEHDYKDFNNTTFNTIFLYDVTSYKEIIKNNQIAENETTKNNQIAENETTKNNLLELIPYEDRKYFDDYLNINKYIKEQKEINSETYSKIFDDLYDIKKYKIDKFAKLKYYTNETLNYLSFPILIGAFIEFGVFLTKSNPIYIYISLSLIGLFILYGVFYSLYEEQISEGYERYKNNTEKNQKILESIKNIFKNIDIKKLKDSYNNIDIKKQKDSYNKKLFDCQRLIIQNTEIPLGESIDLLENSINNDNFFENFYYNIDEKVKNNHSNNLSILCDNNGYIILSSSKDYNNGNDFLIPNDSKNFSGKSVNLLTNGNYNDNDNFSNVKFSQYKHNSI